MRDLISHVAVTRTWAALHLHVITNNQIVISRQFVLTRVETESPFLYMDTGARMFVLSLTHLIGAHIRLWEACRCSLISSVAS